MSDSYVLGYALGSVIGVLGVCALGMIIIRQAWKLLKMLAHKDI